MSKITVKVTQNKPITGIENKVDNWGRKLAFELFRRIIEKTPVDSGRARGSWLLHHYKAGKDEQYYYISSPLIYMRTLEYGEYNKLKKHQQKLGNVRGNVIKSAPSSGGNKRKRSSPRITPQGYSTQAPLGMIRISIAEVESVIKDSF